MPDAPDSESGFSYEPFDPERDTAPEGDPERDCRGAGDDA